MNDKPNGKGQNNPFGKWPIKQYGFFALLGIVVAAVANFEVRRVGFEPSDEKVRAIRNAAANGDVDKIKSLIAGNHRLLTSKDHNGNTPLHMAAGNDWLRVAELLVVDGAEINAKSNLGLTPLHYAAETASPAMAELLLAHRADVDAKSNVGAAAQAIAAGKRSEGFEARDHQGTTPLHWATLRGDSSMVEVLLAHGADVNAIDSMGETPMDWAISKNQQDLAEFLRQHGGHATSTTGRAGAANKSRNDAAESVLSKATKDAPFVNSLGMKFVPAPGTQVLFSIWDTRVEDFRAYARETGYVQRGGIHVMKVVKDVQGDYSTEWEVDEKASWEKPGFEQGEDHPVVGVSWYEAKAFCAWLTEKERKAGKIGRDQEYRLPTDEEWSAAVGESKYPWGNDWPPPEGAGNYADDAFVASLPGTGRSQVPGSDGYARTSPVGAFKANRLGLYDMGGNVWQRCEDWYRAEMNEQAVLEKLPGLEDDGRGREFRVIRGGSWSTDAPVSLWSSFRGSGTPEFRGDLDGFRCVLVVGSSR